MSRVNPNASITLRIKGLGIAHHNTDNGNWEFLFLREIPGHDLKVIIREYKNGLKNPIVTTYPIPADDQRIVITNTDAEPVSDALYTPSSNFDWRVSVDSNSDSRWITDLSEELHQNPVKLTNKLNAKLTCLTVPDAVFYTDTLANRPYNVNLNNVFQYSRVMGAWSGLDIEWSAGVGQTEIAFDSPLLSDAILERTADMSIYEIEVNNDCCAGQKNIPSDFHYYYDYLVDMSGEVFDEEIPFIQPNSAAVSSLSSDPGKEDDCHIVKITRLQDIDSLEELL